MAHGILIVDRLLEKGKVIVKIAYADWSRFRKYEGALHESGIELIEIPKRSATGKNSADIRLVVDAMDLSYAKEHIDIFALLTGDSDFSPLVAKLKENDKRVISCGVKSSTSDLLVAASDEFIYYDDLVRAAEKPKTAARARSGKKAADPAVDRKTQGVEKVMEIVRSLDRDYDQIWGSMVKQTIRRVYPGFNEEYYGYSSFAAMLEELADQELVDLDFDAKRGNYLVTIRGQKRR